MKVILLDEVKGKGREGDVIEVARGFAVNYLLPRKLAVEATSGNLKQLEARKTNIAKREAVRLADAEKVAALIDGKAVVVEAQAGEGGRLFGSVTSHMIEDAILEQLDIEVDRKKLDVSGHLKQLGDHVVTVKVYHDVRAELTVRVVPVGGVLVAEQAPAVAPEQAEEPVEEQAGAEAVAEEQAEAAPEAPAEEQAEEQAEPEESEETAEAAAPAED